MKLEQAVVQQHLGNSAIKEELNKIATSNESALKQLEVNLTSLEDSLKELQDINITSYQKLLLLLQTSRNESFELRTLVSLLRKEIVTISTQFINNSYNINATVH